jgi:hypothetical protein
VAQECDRPFKRAEAFMMGVVPVLTLDLDLSEAGKKTKFAVIKILFSELKPIIENDFKRPAR